MYSSSSSSDTDEDEESITNETQIKMLMKQAKKTEKKILKLTSRISQHQSTPKRKRTHDDECPAPKRTPSPGPSTKRPPSPGPSTKTPAPPCQGDNAVTMGGALCPCLPSQETLLLRAFHGINDWIITHSGGDGVIAEDLPNGADPVPAEVGSTKCFATSYLPSEKHQVIDLVARGIHPDVIDCSKTKIEVGEWYAARFDCASFYKLEVFLLDANYRGTETWEDCILDHFTFEYREEQWVGKEWHKVNHVFENVAKSRFIYFEHHGKDCQFWAGHYGSKMTGAYAKVII